MHQQLIYEQFSHREWRSYGIRIRGDSIGNSWKKLLRKSADLVLPLTFVLAIKTVQSIQVSKLHPLPGKWLLVHVVYTKSTQQIFFVRDFIMSQY